MIVTNRMQHQCQQGTAEWHALRAKRYTASEASAMMGASKYQSRSALLRAKATGIAEEVDAGKQRLFDAGHAAEAAARQIVEKNLGLRLFPVTVTAEVDGLPLLASLDGIDLMGETVWENKLLNESLKVDVQQNQLDLHYAYQLEQQLLVSGASGVYFTASDGTEEGTFGMYYESDPQLQARLVAGWKQFAEDLANYQHVEHEEKPAGAAPEALPALRIEVTGMVTASNIEAFRTQALAVIGSIKKELVTDQDFADAEETVKWCKHVENQLEGAKQHALSQTQSIDELFRAIDQIKEETRSVRLTLDKRVKSEKDTRKGEIVEAAVKQLMDHVAGLKKRIGINALNVDLGVLAEAIRGLKSLDSMRDKVSVALANAKIEANAIADRIDANRKVMEEQGATDLIPDFSQVCTKAPEDFAALIAMRDSRHKEMVERRLDAEREQIRAEEQAKAQREAEQKAAADRQAQPVVEMFEAMGVKVIDATPAVVKESLTVADHIEQPRAMVADHIGDANKMVDTGQTLKLGEICMRLGFTMTADFLAGIGISPVATEKNAKFYRAADFTRICTLLIRHIDDVANGSVRKAA